MSTEQPFIVRLPANQLGAVASNMYSVLQTWEWKTKLPARSTSLELDFTPVRFIEPWALTLFAAYARAMAVKYKMQAKVTLDYRSPANQYLSNMGLVDVVENGISTQDWDDSTQNTGLHIIQTHDDVTRFAESATRLTSYVSSEALDALKYGIHELGRNVVQHAGSQIGGIAIAQYFPDRQFIQIAISDCGQGILKSLSRTYPEVKNELEALKLAILPHVSGAFATGAYSGSENAGLGLFFVKEICWRAGGSFWLASNTALLGVLNDEGKDQSFDRKYRTIKPWNGTCVVMDFPATRPTEFSSLLSKCRDLAKKARENSGEAGLDFLESIPELEEIVIICVIEFLENVGRAAEVRDNQIAPAVNEGKLVVLDFAGTRFVTQSFVHALLRDAFKIPGSLLRMSFANCTDSTREAIATVAAYSAKYHQINY